VLIPFLLILTSLSFIGTSILNREPSFLVPIGNAIYRDKLSGF